MIKITKAPNSEVKGFVDFNCSYCGCEYQADNKSFFQSLAFRELVSQKKEKNIVFAKCPYCGQENGFEIKPKKIKKIK